MTDATRITRKDVERVRAKVVALARDMDLIDSDEVWKLDPGSPTYGNQWELYQVRDGKRYGLSFTEYGDKIGKTSKQAYDFLSLVHEVLWWVQMRQDDES